MRIALFDDLPMGGAKRVVFEQVKGLSAKHEVFYFSSQKQGFFNFGKYAKEVVYWDLELPEHRGVMRPIQEIGLITWLKPQYQKLVWDINQRRVEVSIVHPSRLTQAPMLLIMLKPAIYYAEEWLRVYYEPESFGIEGQGLKSGYEKWRRRMVAAVDWMGVKSAAKVVCNSGFTKEKFKKAYGSGDYEVVWPGVDTKVFYPGSETKKYFLFVGEKDEINGFDLLNEALEKSPIPFKVKYVTFRDQDFALSDAEMNRKYQEAVATLCLGKKEPFGLAAIESMAAGTPVIAVREGGYMETVVDGETGLIIERSADALYKAMKTLALEKEMRERMGKTGRRRVVDNFGWKEHVKKLEQMIKIMVKG